MRMVSLIAALLVCVETMAAPVHPLDPLTWKEHWQVLQILQTAGKIDGDSRFTRIALRQPDKNVVWSWRPRPGAVTSRLAEVIVKQEQKVFEGIVDLDHGTVASWTERKGVQVAWLDEEYESELLDDIKGKPEFRAALRKRGIESTRFVDCEISPRGYLGEQKLAGHRAGIVTCRPVAGVRNTWARRIEGLAITVDVDTGDILEFEDVDTVPVPKTTAEFDESATGPLRKFPAPIELRQPLGPGFSIDGNLVSWDRWRFHVQSDQRVGTMVSTVVWKEGTHERPILYQGYLSEIFVPYMDPGRYWYTRTYLDLGEYSGAGLATPLTPGIDCPDTAAYVNTIVSDDRGRPVDNKRVACLFERYDGNVNWRHADDGRPQRELVVRMATQVDNYDYLIDWIFDSSGQIRVAVGATGIVETRMSTQQNARTTQPQTPAADQFGHFVDDHIVAVNHDHYFNFRLDLDVDGPRNSFMLDQLTPMQLPADNPRKSVWVKKPVIARTEREGQLDAMHSEALWRVLSDARTNRVGYPTSYQLLPGMSDHTLMSPQDYARRRAGFVDHDLWVTAYRADERYADGDYPTLSEAGAGLSAWTAANRQIEKTDIVLWYTIGMHHAVRTEDWPVMPVLWHDFVLRPFDFFDRNPSLDSGRVP